jgi:serine/threonine-protein kinase PpkA
MVADRMLAVPPADAALIQLPGYTVISQIGRGGMATVYRARQTLLDREVALKVMSPQLAQDPVYAQRFLQEARMLAALNHPHVVPVYDVGVTPDGLHYFSMQLLTGGDFTARMSDGLSELELVRVLIAVAHALGFAHARGYVHRDVTPANILFDAHDTPILTDFGIARAVTSSSRITASGLSIGTSHYMSPEQARGAEVDHRSDIYSLGVLCFEAVAGHPPFEGEDGFAVAFAHVHDPVPRLPEEVARWQPLIDRAMAKEPAQRYADCAAFIEGLHEIAPEEFRALGSSMVQAPAKRVPGSLPMPASRPRLRLPPPPPWPVLVLAVLAGLLIGVAIWFAVRPPAAGGQPDDPVASAPPANVGADSAGATADALPADAAGSAVDGAAGAADAEAEAEAEADGGSTPMAAVDGDAGVPAASGEPHTVTDPVAALLAMGRTNIAARRLMSPAGNNALERFRLALQIEPGNADAARGIADVAQAYLDLAAERGPEVDPEAWIDLLARAERVAGEHPQAAAKADAARAERERFAADQRERGRVALARWDRESAAAAYGLALRAAPDDPAARRALAQVDRLGAPGYRFRDGEDTALPEMVVVAPGFALGRTEVTVAEFRRYWQEAGRARFGPSLPACRDRESMSPFRSSRSRTWEAPGIPQGDDHPVVCVSFAMAEAYAEWLGNRTGRRYRLPRVDELAPFTVEPQVPCRANLRDAAYRAEFGGRDTTSCNDGHAGTAPVASFPRIAPGLRDTQGNVREWTADCPGTACRERIAFGLGWHSPAGAPNQQAFAADGAYNTVGLRVVREID